MKTTVKTRYTELCVIYFPFTQEIPWNQEGFKLKGALQLLVYTEHVNLLSYNMKTVKKKAQEFQQSVVKRLV